MQMRQRRKAPVNIFAQSQLLLCHFVSHHFNFQKTFFVNILNLNYRKVPKFLDARKLCCNLPKIVKEAKPKGISSKTCKWNSKQ